jgi:tetratricopeptide (TPR) repeat protein
MKLLFNIATILLLLSSTGHVLADNPSFTNSLAQANLAEKQGDLQGALKIYDTLQTMETTNAPNMCVLARCYCDLTYMTNSTAAQKDLVAQALACAQQAVEDDPSNSTAHASVAVCYAKSCSYADIKTELDYSRLFKQEAEAAIALDPKQDVAYYLLGRWNYALASVGFLSRAYVKVVYGGLPQASYADAVSNFQKACELAPGRILNHAGLAMAFDALGEKKLEIAELQKCCALKPLRPEDVDAQKDAEKKLAALQ